MYLWKGVVIFYIYIYLLFKFLFCVSFCLFFVLFVSLFVVFFFFVFFSFIFLFFVFFFFFCSKIKSWEILWYPVYHKRLERNILVHTSTGSIHKTLDILDPQYSIIIPNLSTLSLSLYSNRTKNHNSFPWLTCTFIWLTRHAKLIFNLSFLKGSIIFHVVWTE